MEKQAKSSLRAGCLNFTEVTAIAIALISPTMTGALIIPLMYSNAGNASWLAYLFGTVMLLFVALNLNQFARRSTSTGSMYAYTVMGLGATAGGISAWCLVWAYLFDGIGGITGATIFANALLGMAGLQLPNLLLFAILCAIVWLLAYKDIRVSSILMLVFETVSVSLTLVLAMAVLHRHNFAIDTAQVTLKGASFSGVALGVNIALFSMVGFESASAFGEEAKDPLVTIPRALIVSLLLTGLFFVIIILHRGSRIYGLPYPAGEGRGAAQHSCQFDEHAVSQNSAVRRCRGQLIFGGPILPQCRRADPLSDGPPWAPAFLAWRRARDQ
ncbi:MAG TPA: APC family permease [Candidatus Binataceae bacterium]|nr:APC family permease [Candidatus Binataceae bacterium]